MTPTESRGRWGTSPAVLVVDVSRRRADPALDTAVSQAVDVADRIPDLLEVARATHVPVLFTRGGLSYYTSGGVSLSDAERGGWTKQNPIRDGETAEDADRAIELAPQLSPEPGEPVITKTGTSAFFKTMLPVYLSSQGIDTVVVVGIHTSGCIRATVTDAFQHDYWVVVPEECVADIRQSAHEYNIEELDRKYADVEPAADVKAYLRDVE